jgi:hypothetical protein
MQFFWGRIYLGSLVRDDGDRTENQGRNVDDNKMYANEFRRSKKYSYINNTCIIYYPRRNCSTYSQTTKYIKIF